MSNELFQSTPSLRRATYEIREAEEFLQVSIHALLAESDMIRMSTRLPVSCFNPRPPCGERLVGVRKDLWRSEVSIHALLAESDYDLVKSKDPRQSFNPRPPCGERHNVSVTLKTNTMVSIHALLAESDSSKEISGAVESSFNPRPPCGERLPQRYMLLINHASEALRQLHEDGTSHTVFSSSYLVVNLRFPMSYKNRRPPGNLM